MFRVSNPISNRCNLSLQRNSLGNNSSSQTFRFREGQEKTQRRIQEIKAHLVVRDRNNHASVGL